MKINVTNIEQIKAALDQEAGKARSHTLTNEHFPLQLAQEVENQLLSEGVLKKHLVGCSVIFSSGGPSANAYSYKAIGSWLRVERFATGWFLTKVQRCDVWPKQKSEKRVYITESASADILSKYIVIRTADEEVARQQSAA